MIQKKHITLLGVMVLLLLQSCSEFLDSKPNKNLVILSTLDDFQQLLDAEGSTMNNYLNLGLISSDDVYFGENLLSRLSFSQQAYYLWEEETYMPDAWDAGFAGAYEKVLYANVVLDGLRDYEPVSEQEKSRMAELEASARFFRAMGHFEVLMHFSEPYDPDREDQLGIPIRLTSDINVKVGRPTMKESFAQIISDLQVGTEFLPIQSEIPTRPSQWAALAMLGRIYLVMQEYDLAYEYSEKALAIGDELMDFKTLDSELPYSFEVFNPEVIFYQKHLSSRFTGNGDCFVNPDLVELYDSADLRREYFLLPAKEEGLYNFRGNFTGDFYHFGGMAVDEVWLNLAESAVRTGKEALANDALRYLLESRMDSNFIWEEDLTGKILLERILEERRKELAFRGIRWLDLKRLNQEEEFAMTLERKYNEEKPTLPPGDTRYTFLIPPAEINLNPMEQNVR
ncbi:RagB/SusD family nutrient uptake outer membrane protein [Algoriphagus pacificus]|uniref:RagB/SusD family nutrient uptake outer membrane protein n=1 Tax=Algoriphagus pacificus TaxID=2811234 RepID=A0ABS3CK50_9BACT|nr:RagB/SusD family nutrient uptake outer membrane protein [Algoriphagus pacificus]MBN7816914.1 RagB/SusD family nutrient uptake outer membrane protein [Algoriphagus pacificus]